MLYFTGHHACETWSNRNEWSVKMLSSFLMPLSHNLSFTVHVLTSLHYVLYVWIPMLHGYLFLLSSPIQPLTSTFRSPTQPPGMKIGTHNRRTSTVEWAIDHGR